MQKVRDIVLGSRLDSVERQAITATVVAITEGEGGTVNGKNKRGSESIDNARYLSGLDFMEDKARAWISTGTVTLRWVRKEKELIRLRLSIKPVPPSKSALGQKEKRDDGPAQ